VYFLPQAMIAGGKIESGCSRANSSGSVRAVIDKQK
jgi:hypothetical protein